MHEHLSTMARYNRWATQRLLVSIDAVGENDYRRDLGLFFKSLHGTLNHLLVAEEALWFRRFIGQATTTSDLAHELESDRLPLKQRLQAQGAAWLPWLNGVTDAQLAGPLHYRRVNGETATVPFGATLAHVFNHGTHHRGQMTAALTALGQPCPELDLIYMLIEEGRP